jgi:hypothetical protein
MTEVENRDSLARSGPTHLSSLARVRQVLLTERLQGGCLILAEKDSGI